MFNNKTDTMKPYYKLLNLRGLVTGFGALMLLASCGSYQYAGYDNDGIYTSSEEGEAYADNEYDESYDNALYYKQLFAEKSEEFANVPEEGAIFTDIEGYSSAGQYEDDMFEDEGLDYQVGRAAWGTDPDEISINIYNDPFYFPYGYSPYYAGYYDPYWGPYNPYYGYYGYRPYRYGYGYYSPYRWNASFTFGWGNWGYGRGYGFYDPWFGSYNHYPYYYGGRFYPNSRYRDVAYSTTRRDSYSNYDRYNRSNIQSRSNRNRIQSYSNPRDVRAVRSNSGERTYQTRTSRVRPTSASTRNAAYNRSSSNNRVEGVRSSSQRRSNNSGNYSRSRSNSSRSSGTTRSSSSSSRSSGSSGSSSRSTRGRGN